MPRRSDDIRINNDIQNDDDILAELTATKIALFFTKNEILNLSRDRETCVTMRVKVEDFVDGKIICVPEWITSETNAVLTHDCHI